MHDVVRERLRAGLAERDVDGYLPQTEANLFYVTGYQSGWVDLSWRWMGLETGFIPTDPGREPVLLVSDYSQADARFQSDLVDIRTFSIWVECRAPELVMDPTRPSRLVRPEQYDPAEIYGMIRRIVADSGLSRSVIGTDLGVMRKETYDGLCEALPDCTFVDVSDLLYDLRRVKHAEEVRRLRNAAHVFDEALRQSMAQVREGTTLADLRANFDSVAIDLIRRTPDLGDYQGTFGFNSIGRGDVNRVGHGDIVKVDAGVRLNGYWSDCARVFSYGPPPDVAVQIHDALLSGFEAAEATMRPGATMREVYTAAVEAVRSRGFPNYSRGHVGHSMGLDDQIEEPPFIGPNDTVLEPGMVLALEVPYYPTGLGGFNIEEVLLITDDGVETFNRSPRTLTDLLS